MGGGAQAPIVLSSVVASYITAMLIMAAILFLDNMVVPVVNAKEACNELTPNFYSESCPQLEHIVQTVVKAAVLKETRMAASLMRLEFHDCFVNVFMHLPYNHPMLF
jgi:peroxidase